MKTDEEIIEFLAELLGQSIGEFTDNKNTRFSYEDGLFAGFKLGLLKAKHKKSK